MAACAVLGTISTVAGSVIASHGWQTHVFSRIAADDYAVHDRLWATRYAVLDYLHRDGDSLLRDNRLSYRERAHLREIKQTLVLTRASSYSLLSICAVGLALGWFLFMRESLSGRGVIRQFLFGFGSSMAAICVITVLGVWGFDSLFVWLHQTLFDGRNWVLPASSALYRAYPPVFFEYSLASLAWVCSASGVVAVVAGLLMTAGRGSEYSQR